MVSQLLTRELSCANVTGTGAVYSYDPVGSYEREACRAAGAAQSLLQPFLDNQVGSSPRPLVIIT
jgi:20S proteasome alpha/beta subunit